jgi:hypothetical protein
MSLPTIAYFGRNNADNNGSPNAAGFLYRLKVRLNRAVNMNDNNGDPLTLFFEFQRLVRTSGGFFQEVDAIIFDPTNPDEWYFALPDPNHPNQIVPGFPEKNLPIPLGEAEVISPPFLVRPDAKQSGVSIVFPDYVLCTAYLGDFSDDANVFSSHVLTVIS